MEIAICLNCYYKSDISKLILQLSSLLVEVKFKNINELKMLNSIKFNSINKCIEYLKTNFEDVKEIENSKIHVALYCDGLSGQVYKDINDFKNRIDILEFEEIFKNVVFKIDNKNINIDKNISENEIDKIENINQNQFKSIDKIENINQNQFKSIDKIEINKNVNINENIINLHLTKLPYFIYSLSPSSFPEITNKINEFISKHSKKEDLDLKLKVFKNKYLRNDNTLEFSSIHKFIFDNVYFNKSNIIIYQHIYNKYFKNNDYSNEIMKIINKDENKKYLHGFKLSYSVFIELYQLQPELFDDILEEYFNSKFKNDYSENVEILKQIFNEFHSLHPNSSLQGTKYHTNLMINRTRFLNDFDSSHKFFIDDDDFTGGLNNYYSIYQWYIKNVKINYSKLNKIIKHINPKLIIKNTNSELENRKIIREIIENNIYNNKNRYLYITFMKYCICKFNVWNGESVQNNINAMWNDIIPPYLPLNFLNVQETRCEDSSFNALHFVNNFINNQEIVYYYNSPSLNNYNRDKNFIIEMKIKSIYNYLHKNNLKYLKMNYGRWFYSLNDEIEFTDFEGIDKNIKIY